ADNERIGSLAVAGNTLYIGTGQFSGNGACDTQTGSGCEIRAYDISSSTNPTYVSGRESGVGNEGIDVDAMVIKNDALYTGRRGYSGGCTASTGDGCELLVYDRSVDLSGTFTGDNALGDVVIENGNARFVQASTTNLTVATSTGATFTADLAASGTVTMAPDTYATFAAGSTYSFENIDWQGSATDEVLLRSSDSGTQWNLDVDGTQTVEFVNVQDSDATLTSGGITAATSTDSGNNLNWSFSASSGGGSGVSVWNATDWTSYDIITIDATQVDDDLTDFPVYVDLADLSSQFWSTTPSSASLVGTDIRVTTDAGSPVELPRELVFASSTTETG
ncbi:MAG TPA: hypothetical protein VKP88_08995, partial [Candidatus Paceibacterota bacterium]|nr:hypothetical protein [Candidatus Paceibacterota bacterium]